MDNYTKECLEVTKQALYEQLRKNQITLDLDFSEYSKFYFWTNENINSYLDILNLKNKSSSLTVLASGDQAFNYIAKGLTDIDTFDTNRLTEYFALGIKKNMILQNDRLNYIIKMNKLLIGSKEESIEIIKELLPYMEEQYRFFWNELVEYHHTLGKRYHNNLSIMSFITNDYFYHNAFQDNNFYLLNDENYNLLKNNLKKARITFKYANASNLYNDFNRQYDLINLSNILDYFILCWGENWQYIKLREYEANLKKICNNNSYIILMYMFRYYHIENNKEEIDLDTLFTDSVVTKKNLKGEKIYNLKNSNDAIILKRVRKNNNV